MSLGCILFTLDVSVLLQASVIGNLVVAVTRPQATVEPCLQQAAGALLLLNGCSLLAHSVVASKAPAEFLHCAARVVEALPAQATTVDATPPPLAKLGHAIAAGDTTEVAQLLAAAPDLATAVDQVHVLMRCERISGPSHSYVVSW